MSDFEPPPLTAEVMDLSPDQLLIAIGKVKAAAFHPEIAQSVMVVNAAAKTLLDVRQQICKFGASMPKLRRFLGVVPDKEGRTDSTKKDGNDVAVLSIGDEVKDDEPIVISDKMDQDKDQESSDASHTTDSDEGQMDETKGSSDKDGEKKKGRHNHGRRGKDDFPEAEQRYFVHPDFDHSGCSCPECLDTKVYLMGALGGGIRFTGQSSTRATGLNYEIWRCGGCSAYFPAPLPPTIQNDGGTSRVGYSAAAIISISKYLYGTPWARQERIGAMMEIDLPDSTQCEQSYRVAKAGMPVYGRFFIEAALAGLFYSDDTGNKILNLKFEQKVRRTTGETVTRTGVHTACVVAVLPDGKEIVIYKTAIIHAGELMDEVLINRPKELPAPYHMSDGHAANPPTVRPVISGECNCHARRKVEDKQASWRKVWDYVKSIYKHVYKIEKQAKTQQLSSEDRMALHHCESLPIMKAMFQWMQDCLNNKTVEPNSNLGNVFEYFLVREKGLTAFCFHPGFPLDNNHCENAQKLVALHRKNAEYFRTLRGACVGDVIMSLGATLERCGGNILHYLIALQRYEAEVADRPQDFMPWNYIETVKKLEQHLPVQRWCEVSEAEFRERQIRLRSPKAWGNAKKGGGEAHAAGNEEAKPPNFTASTGSPK